MTKRYLLLVTSLVVGLLLIPGLGFAQSSSSSSSSSGGSSQPRGAVTAKADVLCTSEVSAATSIAGEKHLAWIAAVVKAEDACGSNSLFMDESCDTANEACVQLSSGDWSCNIRLFRCYWNFSNVVGVGYTSPEALQELNDLRDSMCEFRFLGATPALEFPTFWGQIDFDWADCIVSSDCNDSELRCNSFFRCEPY